MAGDTGKWRRDKTTKKKGSDIQSTGPASCTTQHGTARHRRNTAGTPGYTQATARTGCRQEARVGLGGTHPNTCSRPLPLPIS
jgi:hypothetical protein